MNSLLLAFALGHSILFAYSFRFGEARSARIWLLRAMFFSIAFDNVMQGMGSHWMDSSWYETASRLRWFFHAVILPFLTIFAVSILSAAGVGLARRAWFLGAAWAFTLMALSWGFYHEVLLLELEPKEIYGVVKYRNASSFPPIATILTNVAILPMAAVVWRVSGWRWFFLAGLFIFLVNGATASLPWGFLAGNFAELIFVIALLATHWHFGNVGQVRAAGAALDP